MFRKLLCSNIASLLQLKIPASSLKGPIYQEKGLITFQIHKQVIKKTGVEKLDFQILLEVDNLSLHSIGEDPSYYYFKILSRNYVRIVLSNLYPLLSNNPLNWDSLYPQVSEENLKNSVEIRFTLNSYKEDHYNATWMRSCILASFLRQCYFRRGYSSKNIEIIGDLLIDEDEVVCDSKEIKEITQDYTVSQLPQQTYLDIASSFGLPLKLNIISNKMSRHFPHKARAHLSRPYFHHIFEDMKQRSLSTHFVLIGDRGCSYWFHQTMPEDLVQRFQFIEIEKLKISLPPRIAISQLLDTLTAHNVMSFTENPLCDISDSSESISQLDKSHVYSLRGSQVQQWARQVAASSLVINSFIYKKTKACTVEYASLIEPGNDGNYLQYTYSRLCGIQRKSDDIKVNIDMVDWNRICESEAIHVVLTLSSWQEEVLKAMACNDPSVIVKFIQTLSYTLGSAIRALRVKGMGQTLASSRLLLFMCGAAVLKECFSLLGLVPVEFM